MQKRVYVETSVISYLTARTSRDLVIAAWQQTTSNWWVTQRSKFALCTSELVIMEASRGDKQVAALRLQALENIALLPITKEAGQLANLLLKSGALPPKALDDALHISIAAISKTDYLLTWNCRHIDNAETKPLIRTVCNENGFQCPEICTPMELMGIDHDYR